MDVILTYRGRTITATDVAAIQSLIAAHPDASRRRLSALLCEAWNWRQANGTLRDGVCRSLMLTLHRAGEIELPPVRQQPPNNAVARRRPRSVEIDQAPIHVALSALGPVDIRPVRRTTEEALFDSLLAEHHYLGYTRPVGEHVKYLAWAGGRPVACMAWGSAPRHLGPRDRFIGWSMQARQRNLHLLAINLRFLIVPWVSVRYLASHLLGRISRRIATDWQEAYGHPVVYLETFVDPSRFRGTCYRAANWRHLGETTGRGHNDQTYRANRPKKTVWGYPLIRRFREVLGG
ncbi:MAG: DUF4338 domain-containing protein [bacterium]|nr:DUF4338 domain-containing protein [bacterium]